MISSSIESRGDRASAHWTDNEVDESVFKDARLGKRFRELLIRMGGGLGESLPLACQDWANTKPGAVHSYLAGGVRADRPTELLKQRMRPDFQRLRDRLEHGHRRISNTPFDT